MYPVPSSDFILPYPKNKSTNRCSFQEIHFAAQFNVKPTHLVVSHLTERSRNRSHVCSCSNTFFKSRIREKASLKETLTNCTIHGLIFSHGWHSHHKCDAV